MIRWRPSLELQLDDRPGRHAQLKRRVQRAKVLDADMSPDAQATPSSSATKTTSSGADGNAA